MSPMKVVYILFIAGIILPSNALSIQNNSFPPQKRYIFDNTLRPRVFRYCAQMIGIPIKPNRVLSVKDLIKLNDCVDNVIKNSETFNNDDCRECNKKMELLFIDDKGQYHFLVD